MDDHALLSPVGRQFVAGLLDHAREMTVFGDPTTNAYPRFRPYSFAPDRICWGGDNRGALIRVQGGPGDAGTHVENRLSEPAANPYLWLAANIAAGLDGVDRGAEPPEPVEGDPYVGRRAAPAAVPRRGRRRARARRVLPGGVRRRARRLHRDDEARRAEALRRGGRGRRGGRLRPQRLGDARVLRVLLTLRRGTAAPSAEADRQDDGRGVRRVVVDLLVGGQQRIAVASGSPVPGLRA